MTIIIPNNKYKMECFCASLLKDLVKGIKLGTYISLEIQESTMIF